MSASTPSIRYDAKDGLAHITFAHAARMNAMTLGMWKALPEAVARADADPEVRAIVVTGEGEKAFCAGADISEFGQVRATEADVAAYEVAVSAANQALSSAKKPTIALIRGICFGGGFGLAMSCDLRLASHDSRFRIPAARLGLGYGYGGVEALVRRIGMAGVADLLLSARILDAGEALRYSIATLVWERSVFDEKAADYLKTMATNAPLTMQAVKGALTELMRPEAERDAATAEALVAQCFESNDYREGQKAFLEKRAPVFRGR
ncbi:MAG: enoyl-CoA hydratase [Rhizobiales bacterium PAR1]|nr:MAG: enoyl-CoA hydratase [Rhizobiales bacterium PAR1]